MLISQRLRPGEVMRIDAPHFALAPIAGLQLQEDTVSIGGLQLVNCNRSEWETVERGYVFKDWHAHFYSVNPAFLLLPLTASENNWVTSAFDRLAHDARSLVTACRLLKTGPLLEPEFTVRFVHSEGMTHRIVGPYRTEYLAMPEDGMTWPMEPGEAQEVERIYADLLFVEGTDGNEGLIAIINQFNLSCLPATSAFFSIHILLTALEMLFDGLPKRLETPTNAYDRALECLRWFYGTQMPPAFTAFYADHARPLRNAVHHHAVRDVDVDPAAALPILQLTVMTGIRSYLRFSRPEVRDKLADMVEAHGWQGLDAKALMNACLDRSADPRSGIPRLIVDRAALY